MTARAALVGPTNIGRVVVGFMFGRQAQRHRLVGPAMLRRPGQRRMIPTVQNRRNQRAALPRPGAVQRRLEPALAIGAIVAVCWASAASTQGASTPDRQMIAPVVDVPAAMSTQDPPDAKPAVRVSGHVMDRDDKVVDKAEVSFSGAKKGKVWTNTKGEFSFSGPPGDYVVTVTAGERHQNFNVKIEDNQLKPPLLKMNPEGFDMALIRE